MSVYSKICALALGAVIISSCYAEEENTADAAVSQKETQDNNGDFYEGATVYVSDKVNVWMRSGPGSSYRITGTKHVGDTLTFLRFSPGGKYIEVRDGEATHWMQTTDLQLEPNGKALAEQYTSKIKELEEKLANYDSEIAQKYNAAARKLEKLENENAGLKKSLEEKDASLQKLDEERRDYAGRLENKELDMQMRWWLQGALIALGGAIIGIFLVFIPRPKSSRKKRDRF